MEFTLDIPFIRDILEQEHARARDEIRNLGVLRALESSQRRHDARIAATADRLISMRDGAFVDETRLTGGSTGTLGALAGLEG